MRQLAEVQLRRFCKAHCGWNNASDTRGAHIILSIILEWARTLAAAPRQYLVVSIYHHPAHASQIDQKLLCIIRATLECAHIISAHTIVQLVYLYEIDMRLHTSELGHPATLSMRAMQTSSDCFSVARFIRRTIKLYVCAHSTLVWHGRWRVCSF